MFRLRTHFCSSSLPACYSAATLALRSLRMLALFAAFVLFAANVPLTAQTTRYFYNSNGDSLAYSWPPPDSGYVHDHVLLKFHPGALNLNMLCYSYTGAAMACPTQRCSIQISNRP